MQKAGPLKQILRALTVDDLQAVRRKFCPRVRKYREQEGKADLIDSLRRSLKRSMEDDALSYNELMGYIIEVVLEEKPKRVTTRIRHVLHNIQISENAGWKSTSGVRERWICSEIFQGLQYQLQDTNYTVDTEKYVGEKDSYAYADLFVSHASEKRNYIIEVKLAGSKSRRELLTQLMKYNKYAQHVKRIFVLLVVEEERHLPANYTPLQTLIKEVEAKEKVEVIVKPPSDLKY